MNSNYPSCYTKPDEMVSGEVSPRTKEFLRSLDNMSISHKNSTPLHEARCNAITSENQLRLGGLFCLWCGCGPMPTRCDCPSKRKSTKEEYVASGYRDEYQNIPRWRMIHAYPCSQHNHCCPRGMCVGRCGDCGGCNQDLQDCKHLNPSGGPIHPDPSNSVSLPLCPRTSEDRTRCYRQYRPPIIVEEEDTDDLNPQLRIRPDNMNVALILTGVKDSEDDEEEGWGGEKLENEKKQNTEKKNRSKNSKTHKSKHIEKKHSKSDSSRKKTAFTKKPTISKNKLSLASSKKK